MASPPKSQRKKNDRRQALRAMAARRGSAVQWAPAWQSSWDALAPEQRFLNSCGLALIVGAMLAQALGAVVYGQLAVFILIGFADLQGTAAFMGAAAQSALALAWATILWQRHAAQAGPLRMQRWRRRGYIAAFGLGLLAALLEMVSPLLPNAATHQWQGLAPTNEWLLAPLPWAWAWLLPVGSDTMQGWWMLGGVLPIAAALWCFSGSPPSRPRAGLACLGTALVCWGFWVLGGAVVRYAAGRGLGGVHDVLSALAYQSHPGHHNADTLLWWLGGLVLALAGVLLIAGAAYIPPQALARQFQGPR